MSGAHIITASRTHARERLGRLAGLLRGHGDPEGPDEDLQDFGDGMDIKEAMDALGSDETDPFPGYDPDAWWRDNQDRPREQSHEGAAPGAETVVDMHPHAPRRFVAPGARWPDPQPERKHERPLFTPLPAEERLIPLPADAAGRMARITYPPYGASPERYAAVMCQVSGATGTASEYEEPRAWGARQEKRDALPVLDVARVTLAGSGLHRPALDAPPVVRRLAIEAPAALPGVTDSGDEDVTADMQAEAEEREAAA